jgi:uncharacterized membrane protein
MRFNSTLAALVLTYASTLSAQQYTITGLGQLWPYAINDSSTVGGSLGAPIGTAWTHTVLWNNGIITQLQAAPTFQVDAAMQINKAGQVLGLGVPSLSTISTFVWDPTNGFTYPATVNGHSARFTAINNLGQLGGTDASGSAAIWSSPNSVTLLPPLGGNNLANEVRSLNDVGQAVGTSGFSPDGFWPGDPDAPYGACHAALWQNGSVLDLTPTHPYSRADAIKS